MKKFLFWLAFIGLIGGGGYFSLNYHLVWYRSKAHLIEKDHWTFSDTFINLDKSEEKWCQVVMESKTLQKYFLKHYFMTASKKKISCAVKTVGRQLVKNTKEKISKSINETGELIKREAQETIKKLKKGVEDALK